MSFQTARLALSRSSPRCLRTYAGWKVAIVLIPSISYHLPRSLVILKSLSMIVLAAGLPGQRMIFGFIASIWPCRYGLQALISLVLGWRFFIRPPSSTAARHLTMLVR